MATDALISALGDERLPAAVVDLDALDHNIDALVSRARAANKPMRIATKSIRSVALIDYILERGGDALRGLMCYSASEAKLLAESGHDDLLVAYPSVQPVDMSVLAELNAAGTTASIVVDAEAHLKAAATAGRRANTEIPLVIEVDMSLHWRGAHVGVHRSPLRRPEAVTRLARRVDEADGARFHGIMGYEAQIAGVGDTSRFSPWLNPLKRTIKRLSRPRVAARRRAVVADLRAAGLAPTIVNGGGTGSLSSTCRDPSVTEVTAGSGFLCSHLFDNYADLTLEPASFFALQVVRKPGAGIVTCHGGGFVASGEAGLDRLPLPVFPTGLSLTRLEGAGEVQTPLTGAAASLDIGDAVLFRHAKAGELAEQFNRYVLVRGGAKIGEAQTYRGGGHRFL